MSEKSITVQNLNGWGEAASTWYAGRSALLRQRRMIMMRVGHLVECELAGETGIFGENLPQCHSTDIHITWTEFEPGPLWWEAGD
jgi:hypothetical protein